MRNQRQHLSGSLRTIQLVVGRAPRWVPRPSSVWNAAMGVRPRLNRNVNSSRSAWRYGGRFVMEARRVLAVLLTIVVFVFAASLSQAQEQVVHLVTITGGGAGKLFGDAADLFNRQFRGRYRVEVTKVSEQFLFDKLMAQFISGRPSYDLITMHDSNLEGVLQYLAPLDALIKKHGGPKREDFGFLSTSVIEEGQWKAFPVRLGLELLYYQKDIFSQLGLKAPSSWSEFLAAARKLKQHPRIKYPTTLRFNQMSETTEMFDTFYRTPGGEVVTPDKKHASPVLKSEYAVGRFSMMRQLVQENLVPNPVLWTLDDNITGIQQGSIGMVFDASARTQVFTDPAKSAVAKTLGFATVPLEKLGPGRTGVHAFFWIVGIDRNSTKKDAAYQFLKFITEYGTQKTLALEHGNGPSVVAVYSDKEYGERNPSSDAIKQSMLSGGAPIFAAPGTSRDREIHAIIQEEMHFLVLNQKSPEAVANNLYNRIEKLLRGDN